MNEANKNLKLTRGEVGCLVVVDTFLTAFIGFLLIIVLSIWAEHIGASLSYNKSISSDNITRTVLDLFSGQGLVLILPGFITAVVFLWTLIRSLEKNAQKPFWNALLPGWFKSSLFGSGAVLLGCAFLIIILNSRGSHGLSLRILQMAVVGTGLAATMSFFWWFPVVFIGGFFFTVINLWAIRFLLNRKIANAS